MRVGTLAGEGDPFVARHTAQDSARADDCFIRLPRLGHDAQLVRTRVHRGTEHPARSEHTAQLLAGLSFRADRQSALLHLWFPAGDLSFATKTPCSRRGTGMA